MNSAEFDKIVEERCNKIKEILILKGKEYATDTDRLHNFNRASIISQQSREKALWGFALKHYVSYIDILDNVEKGKLPSIELLDEKIGDLINYLILCEICIKEKIKLEEFSTASYT